MIQLVSSNPAPSPPYPSDTYVRGWKFQIDHERLFSSDTWALASPEMRPWLLMLWHTAWVQRPAGAFPDDNDIIAAKIGMDQRLFVAHRDILMRGWVKYSDGRLYHPVIIEQVHAFQEHNRKERDRVARWRESRRSNDGVTRNKRVSTTPEPEPEPEPDITEPTVQSENPARVSTQDRVPYAKITELWAEMLPELPQPLKLTPARKANIRARWQDELPDLESWQECFSHIKASPFMMGKVDPPPGRKRFRCTLDWITKQSNLLKLYEGKYDG